LTGGLACEGRMRSSHKSLGRFETTSLNEGCPRIGRATFARNTSLVLAAVALNIRCGFDTNVDGKSTLERTTL
jgi:hypothetical protein